MSFVSALDLPIPAIEGPSLEQRMNEKDKVRFEILKNAIQEYIQGELFEKYKNFLKVGSGQELLQKLEAEFLNDLWYYRYVKVDNCIIRKGYGDDYIKFMKAMVEWRVTYRPERLRLCDFAETAPGGFIYFYGHDLQGHPILWLTVGKDTRENDATGKALKFNHLVYLQQTYLKKCPKNIYSCIWVVELKDSSLSLSLVKSMKYIFDKLGEYYAESLQRAIILNSGWGITLCWNFIKAFLTKEQQAKYVFIGGSPEKIRAKLLEYISEENLIPEFYNGKANYTFNYEFEVKRETELYGTRLSIDKLDLTKDASALMAAASSAEEEIQE